MGAGVAEKEGVATGVDVAVVTGDGVAVTRGDGVALGRDWAIAGVMIGAATGTVGLLAITAGGAGLALRVTTPTAINTTIRLIARPLNSPVSLFFPGPAAARLSVELPSSHEGIFTQSSIGF
jgi:hypothetical protein